MAIAYQFFADGTYCGEIEDFGFLPNNATYKKPPELGTGWPNKFPVFNKATDSWSLVDDFRRREASQDILAQEATLYYLPEDTYESQGREMEVVGSLPEGATFNKPEKPYEIKEKEAIETFQLVRKQKLEEYDAKIAQLNRLKREAEALETDPSEINKLIDNWDTYATLLCDMPELEGYPWVDSEIPWPEKP